MRNSTLKISNSIGFSIIEVLVSIGVLAAVVSSFVGHFKQSVEQIKLIEDRNLVVDLRRYIKLNIDCPETLNQVACNRPQGEVNLLNKANSEFLGGSRQRNGIIVRGVCGTNFNPNEMRIEYSKMTGSNQGTAGQGHGMVENWKDIFDGIPVACAASAVAPGNCPYLDQTSGIIFPDMYFDLGMPLTDLYLPGSRLGNWAPHGIPWNCAVGRILAPGAHRVQPPWSPRVIGHAGITNGYVGNDYTYVFWNEATNTNCSSPGYYLVTIQNARTAACTLGVSVILGARGGAGCFKLNARVLMADFTEKPIQLVRVGDKVWNPKLRKPVTVTEVIDGVEKKPLLIVNTESGKIEVTENHPFLTEKGVVLAKHLQKGDSLYNKTKIVDIVESEDDLQQVYNFAVDGINESDHVISVDGIPTGDLFLQKKYQ